MHRADPWAIALVVLAFTAVPPSLALPLIGILGKKWKLSVIFGAVLGGFGFLALGIAALGRAMVANSGNGSDVPGLMAFGLGVSLLPFGGAVLLLGRALTTERAWKVVGSALLTAVGTTAALGCLLVHQIILADHSGRYSEPGLIMGALFGGIPVAILGLVLLAWTASKAEPAVS